MAQNKIEKDFGKKLNEREIQPSPMAWDRLDAMLTVAEQKKSGKKYNWLYVAAGLFGFLFIGTFLFTQTEEMTDAGQNGIVIENNSKDSLKANPIPEIISPVYENKAQNTTLATTSEKRNAVEPKTAVKAIKGEPLPASQKPAGIINQNQINQSDVVATNSNPIINQKTEQLKSTYINVDELLASVDKAPAKKEPAVKVNADNLLSQVDGELELSFRERVIKTVSRQYKNVKVALSNRNVQN